MWQAYNDHLNIKHNFLLAYSPPFQDGEGGTIATEQGMTSAFLKNIWF
jgi:hypothetical protein